MHGCLSLIGCQRAQAEPCDSHRRGARPARRGRPGGVELFLGGIAVLAILSLVVKARAGVKKARAAAEIARVGTSPVSLVGHVLLTAGLIVGTQWSVITYAADNLTLLLVVPAVPAWRSRIRESGPCFGPDRVRARRWPERRRGRGRSRRAARTPRARRAHAGSGTPAGPAPAADLRRMQALCPEARWAWFTDSRGFPLIDPSGQKAVYPPSTGRTAPVMYDDSDDARKRTASATSSAVARRWSGI